MKSKFIIPIFAATLIFAACNQNTSNQSESDDQLQNEKCYMAVSNSDSASLSFGEDKNRIVGKLAFNFNDKEDTEGTISGEFKGDTLFVEYAYVFKGTKYSNPQVFLKKDGKLIQGHGEMRTTLGRTYFEDHAQIEFDAFVFEETDCK